MSPLIPTSYRNWLRVHYNRRARQTLYPVNPRIGTIFASRPWIVFCAFSLSALLLLVLPS